MGRLLIALKSICEVDGLFNALKPEMFQHFISATKVISGYDINTKSFKSPSLAMHVGTSLKTVCDVAYKLVIEKKNIPSHWCSELSRLALKNLKERHWEKPLQLPLTSDLQLFNEYLNKLADEAIDNLSNDNNSKIHYKQLTECVLAKTVIFNRKRIGDVQYLKIYNYIKDYSTINQEYFTEALTEVEKIICENHKRIVTGGKGSKSVPILFTKQTQKYIKCLLRVRQETDIVPKSNPYLFANPDSENHWMAGVNIMRKLARSCGAKHPELLTSTKFRKHVATALQLMTIEDTEMEQITTFMGHMEKKHAEFYRLPQDIYQTAKVTKILLLMEKGRGNQFQGKNLNKIEIDNEIYYSSESECDEQNEQKSVG
ncbi:hypothetical protein NQ314_004658 [Rhamnusium bicolor]|uniref:Tyr recombinase domain-containing protein n=1 Tax=Rhamnusium bicolor TaxID=1586634 RepID=A0AAV8ZLQ2_9CUCU|nr:hypothetical protein NQ314_004658 [Rhamnusium bicolor]